MSTGRVEGGRIVGATTTVDESRLKELVGRPLVPFFDDNEAVNEDLAEVGEHEAVEVDVRRWNTEGYFEEPTAVASIAVTGGNGQGTRSSRGRQASAAPRGGGPRAHAGHGAPAGTHEHPHPRAPPAGPAPGGPAHGYPHAGPAAHFATTHSPAPAAPRPTGAAYLLGLMGAAPPARPSAAPHGGSPAIPHGHAGVGHVHAMAGGPMVHTPSPPPPAPPAGSGLLTPAQMGSAVDSPPHAGVTSPVFGAVAPRQPATHSPLTGGHTAVGSPPEAPLPPRSSERSGSPHGPVAGGVAVSVSSLFQAASGGSAGQRSLGGRQGPSPIRSRPDGATAMLSPPAPPVAGAHTPGAYRSSQKPPPSGSGKGTGKGKGKGKGKKDRTARTPAEATGAPEGKFAWSAFQNSPDPKALPMPTFAGVSSQSPAPAAPASSVKSGDSSQASTPGAATAKIRIKQRPASETSAKKAGKQAARPSKAARGSKKQGGGGKSASKQSGKQLGKAGGKQAKQAAKQAGGKRGKAPAAKQIAARRTAQAGAGMVASPAPAVVPKSKGSGSRDGGDASAALKRMLKVNGSS